MSTAESSNSAQVSSPSVCRLAVYGSLAACRPNHHQMRGLSGRWIEGTVRAELLREGWGAELGYPGLVLDPDGPTVGVQPFDSPDLADHWTRLDEFEGIGLPAHGHRSEHRRGRSDGIHLRTSSGLNLTPPQHCRSQH